MLCGLLDSHPDIACVHELYRYPKTRSDYRAAMEKVADATGKPVVVGHAQFTQLHSRMLTDSIKRLLLIREDKLYGAVSAMLMGIPRAHGLFRLTPDQVAQVKDERALYTELMRPHAHATVTYEQCTQGQEVTTLAEPMGRVLCDFFGVAYHPLTTTVRKSRPKLPANYEELENA